MNYADYKSFLNKILIFYKPDIADYWNSITECSISNKPDSLGRYYLDFRSKKNYPGRFDKNGIPIYKHRNFDPFFHPIVICQYAFAIFEYLFHTGFKDEELKKKFINQADWLRFNCVELNGKVSWHIKYDIDEWKIKAPWISAMAQGEAISVLTRAYLLTKNDLYLQLSESAIKLFEITVKNGGILNYFEKYPVYEEYPTPLKTVGVLNGFNFALFGLYDLWLLNKNDKAKELFEQGTESLVKLLPVYDIGYWSQYHLYRHPKKYPASYTYHNIAIEQLKALHCISGEKIIKEYSDLWSSYNKSFLKKTRALCAKLIGARTLK